MNKSQNGSNEPTTISYQIPVSDLAITTNTDDLTCIICLNICFKPIVTSCCEKLICLDCTKQLVKHSLKCPYCNEINMNFEKPSKLVYRLFENLSFHCPNECGEKVKYYFYFNHVFNECTKPKEELQDHKYCKSCQIAYNFKENEQHSCDNYQQEILDSVDSNELSAIEQKLEQLSLAINNNSNMNNKICSNNDLSNMLPNGTINIPRLHNHNLILTNKRDHPEYSLGWVCELCSDTVRNPETKSYHCEQCIYDICQKCYLHISTRLPNTTCHNHELNLEIREIEWQCNLCHNIYYKRRSWFCDNCDFDVCFSCYWK
jgi:hypothetical protein